MVIIIEDGKSVKTAKAFSYNLTEKIQLFAQNENKTIRKRNNSVSFSHTDG
jgi:hypothetical protein